MQSRNSLGLLDHLDTPFSGLLTLDTPIPLARSVNLDICSRLPLGGRGVDAPAFFRLRQFTDGLWIVDAAMESLNRIGIEFVRGEGEEEGVSGRNRRETSEERLD